MDPRIKKTKRDIRNALVELLKEMPYEKVTIKLVSERALVARPTFYAHYNSIEDILIDYLTDLFDTTSSIPEFPKDLSVGTLRLYFEWITKLRDIIDLLYKNNLEGILYKLNRKHIYFKNLLQPEQLKNLPKTDMKYKKYVEVMGGILFAQVVSLVESDWNIDIELMAENAYRTSMFVVNELLDVTPIIV